MNTPRSSLLILASLLVPLLACGMLKKKPPEADTSAVASAAPAPPATVAVPVPTAPPEVKVADEAIPTSEDFEDEAFQKVTDKTYKAELEALKKDIAAKP
jgi:apolipoprotein N-acyltransferase